MYQFFIEQENITEDGIWITDSKEVNHIKNVLRMKQGEKVTLCCQQNGREYVCAIAEFSPGGVRMVIEDISGETRELPVDITLFQCLPKGDKMELIIQKAVELGASAIIPVASGRSVVKLDEKKAAKKVQRWQEIAKSAAKQAKRTKIPEVGSVRPFAQAVEDAAKMDMLLLPYEDAKGMAHSREVMAQVAEKKTLGIIIGPEGGFQEKEVALAVEHGAHAITLGRRILRTETAGMAVLSVLMFLLEEE
ncbi:MAG: 16S rRNA (uracil(1498)-N(3))-methyltransferase [Eubacteriales bacterium]|nr:16S rRNA (uracil(1498)-N(3))-methyltransferase [Eubacteriales bacterium]